MNARKKDILDDLKNANNFDQSGIYKLIYEAEYGMPGGNPYGMILGDYEFDVKDPDDMTILEGVSGVASNAHAPFVAGVSPAAIQVRELR